MKKLLFALMICTAMLSANAPTHPEARDYFREVTPAEWRVMHTIVTTLSDTMLPFLWPKESFLEREGARIDHIHPLRFLHTLFTNEELKVATRNIKNRPHDDIVWRNFSARFGKSLDLSRTRDNISDEAVVHFATELELDVDRVRGLVAATDWEGLMNILATEIARQGDFRRYDL